ncbi:MAG: trehalose-6-phosphate synthase [Actinomycetes bacterium]
MALDDRDHDPLVVIANRLPVRRTDAGWRPAAGGLVTALRPVVERTDGAWIGWDGGERDIPHRVEGLEVDLEPVRLTEAQVDGYYHGFANRTIWPLFHDLIVEPVIDRAWWRTYVEVNRAFAERVADLDLPGDRPVIWVHDYHLMLLPELVRGIRPDSPIGFFLHIPFPPPELMARLPWREDLLRGLLGADVVAFHTERYRDNFCRAVAWVFPGAEVVGQTIHLGGRSIRTAAHGISIDTEEFTTLARSEESERELAGLREQFAGRSVFLGVDRVDYTKGIRHRLQAIERLLERDEDLRRRFAFVQIAVPSREDVAEYQALREEIEGEVGRINGRFTEPGGNVPVHYLYRGITKSQLAAYYRLADVMCVTPLKDGMNLVAKEYVTCQAAGDGAGVLLLSEFTGASLELPGAVTCNPFDVEGLSSMMSRCLELDEADRRSRIAALADHVARNDVFAWVDAQLADLAAAHPAGR